MQHEKRQIENPGSDREIWQLTDGSESRRSSVRSYFDFCPWSPDQRKIAFLSHNEDRAGMEVCWLDLESGTVHSVAGPTRFDSHDALHLQWSPDGSALAFADGDRGEIRFQTVDINTGASARFEGVLESLHPISGHALAFPATVRNPSVPPRENNDIWTVETGTGSKSVLVSFHDIIAVHPERQRIEDFQLFAMHGKWSPDGGRILFVLTDFGLNNPGTTKRSFLKTLYSMHADCTRLRAHTTHPSHMTWHPDGRRILTNCRDEAGGKILALLDVETDEVEVIASPHPGAGGGSHPSFSPDGKFILLEKFTHLSGKAGIILCELLLLDLSSQRTEQLAIFPVFNYSHTGIHVHPSWSPDGKSVLYHSDQTGCTELYEIRVF